MVLPRSVAGIVVASATLAVVGMAYSQDYPNKTVRIVAGGAGGGSDFTARQIAQGIAGPLGQAVVVENRGAGILSAEFLSKAAADGYTFGVNGANLWVSPIMEKTPYDPIRDFTPVSVLTRDVFILAVHPSLPVKSVKELIALAKAKPGELNYASTGAGGPQRLATELLKSLSGVNIVNVAYKTNAQGITALISGEVQMTILDLSLIVPHVKSGRMRALAVTSATPSALTPDLPTVAASGLPGYEWVGLTAMFAPAKTPDAIVNRINQEVVRFMTRPEIKTRFIEGGSEVVASTPEQAATTIKSDIAKVTKVLKDAGIKTNG